MRRSASRPSQPGLSQRAEAQVVGDAQPGVGGRLLGDEADLRELGRAAGRPAAEDLDRAGGRREQADRQVQQRGLAGPVGPDQADDPPGGDGQVAVATAPSVRP